ncbi:MAG: 50S ribosomal protein L9 [Patescibacteria group bacterium]|nr:50S ribosomal protein L9 [Patescibacteria group bacterium]
MKKKRKKEEKLPILLLEDIVNLGQKGQVVKVRKGYFRYLVSQGKAVLADEKKLSKELKPLLLSEKIKTRENLAQKLKEEIEKLTIDFKISKYTSVTREKITKILKDKGINIAKGSIELKEKIKEAGEYQLPIKVGYNIVANLRVIVKD